jgi:hypothetical protein
LANETLDSRALHDRFGEEEQYPQRLVMPGQHGASQIVEAAAAWR